MKIRIIRNIIKYTVGLPLLFIGTILIPAVPFLCIFYNTLNFLLGYKIEQIYDISDMKDILYNLWKPVKL